MNIIFKTIKIKNFLSFGECEFNLERNGFIHIYGVNNSTKDSANSNGSGKSALFDALVWALTGETIRGLTNDVCNLYTNEGCSVEVEFLVDNIEYKVARTRNHSVFKNNLFILKNGEELSGKGLRDSEKILSELLPDLTFNLLSSVVVLGQGLPNRFSNNTPSGRKELLESLTNTGYMIDYLKSNVEQRRALVDTHIREIEDNKLKINTNIHSLDLYIESDKNELERMASTESLSHRLNELGRDKDAITELLKEYTMKKDEISEKHKRVNDIISSADKDCEIELQKINYKYSGESSELNAELTHINYLIDDCKKELKKYNGDKPMTVCPTCGRQLDVDTCGQSILNLIKDIETELATLNEQQFDVRSRLTQLKYCWDNAILTVEIEHKNSIKTYTNESKELESELYEVDKKLVAFNNDLSKLNRDIVAIESQIAFNDELRNTINKRIFDNSNMLVDLQLSLQEQCKLYEEWSQRQTILKSMQSALSRDFRGILLQSVIEFLQSIINIYSNKMFGMNKIKLTLDSNNLLIVYEDKQYEALSGGERQRCDIILQLSIRELLCRLNNFSSNIICMDELFDNIDSKGCESIINVLTTALQDVKSTYIITHHADIPLPIDETITVVKNNDGISEIRL